MNSIQNSFMKPHRSTNFLMANSSFMEPKAAAPVADSNQVSSINEKKIGEVWSKHNFDTDKVKVENIVILGNVKTTWGASSGEDDTDKVDEQVFGENEDRNELEFAQPKESKSTDPDDDSQQNLDQAQEETSPSHHARRPPNAFLIFCKKHRPIVRERFPSTENRGVTKILGEWWALLNVTEKQPYNDLAKEYKDAFLSANPGFRWYKLPAPPLRTLATRPTTITKPPPVTISITPPAYLSEFTPGKLADESQLGGLTSLMNNNFSHAKKMEEDPIPCWKVENNNNENPNSEIYKDTKMDDKIQDIFSSPTNISQPTLPPKPIKKRIFEQYEDEKSCSKNIFEETNGITQQDLLNKVVDGIFANEKEEPKEQRKSDRMCKGKRYERFMVEGKLLGNKRDTKLTQHHRISRIESKIEHELTITKPSYDSPKFNLENTIKRLAERTHTKIDYDEETKPKMDRVRTTSETSEGSPTVTKSPQANFNLDLRIDNLPSLSYDDFVKRKRENKKRKQKIKSESTHIKIQRLENNNVTSRPEVPPAVGSRKRKNKLSITHLNKMEEDDAKAVVPQMTKLEEDKDDKDRGLPNDNALLGLATLAMVAASTEKIGENVGT